MARTDEQKAQAEIDCYGITGAQADESIADCITWNRGSIDFAIASMLSDAQASIEVTGDTEHARHIMNICKRVLFNREEYQKHEQSESDRLLEIADKRARQARQNERARAAQAAREARDQFQSETTVINYRA